MHTIFSSDFANEFYQVTFEVRIKTLYFCRNIIDVDCVLLLLLRCYAYHTSENRCYCLIIYYKFIKM